jgi:pyruvate decarboxylase
MCSPYRFVLNNDGYTVERLIHGMEADYNEVAHWDYSSLAKAFGPRFPSKYHGPIKTADDLVSLLKNPELREECFQLVELVLNKHDAPLSVRLTGAAIDEFNKAK